MPFRDYAVFYEIGREFWRGHYSALSLYPLPAVLLFALFALFPPEVGAIFLFVSSLTLIVVMFKRRALAWMFYMPILQTLQVGQLDIWALWLYWLNTPLSLILLSLKPQLFIVALPRLLADRALLKRVVVGVAILYGVPTLIYPQWIGQWLRQSVSDGRIDSISSPLIVGAALVVMALTLAQRWHWLTAVSTFNPAWRSYDFTLLAGNTLWLIPVSIGAWLLMGIWAAGWTMAACGLVAGISRARSESRAQIVPVKT